MEDMCKLKQFYSKITTERTKRENIRMSEERLTKRIIVSDVEEARERSRPRRRWKDE